MHRRRDLSQPQRVRRARLRTILALLVVLLAGLFANRPVRAQLEGLVPGQSESPPADATESTLQTPEKVEVQPVAQDEEIAERLKQILTATEWFTNPKVEVRESVVFLSGTTTTEQYRTWAGDLARKTQDVVAVVNRIEVRTDSLWDLSAAWSEVGNLWGRLILSLPYLLFAAIVLTLSWWLAKLGSFVSRSFLFRRIDARLLREVLARSVGVLLFLLGLYIVLRVSGLTRLAVTVLGGTGLVGLIIGIAFRDITENFLASIFLSMHTPFRTGDLVEISSELGYVQRLTTRTTILMTLDGNHVQIPNSTVYKSVIRNYTSNPNRRVTFSVGIGYDDAIAEAQEAALAVLNDHPAVLKDPEPWILVDSLGSSTVNLQIYFWVDGSKHSWLKVKSSVIRLIKRAFQAGGISMPDDAREVIFPSGVTVNLKRPQHDGTAADERLGETRTEEPATVSQEGEAGLDSEADQIQRQADQARSPEEGADLLKGKGQS